MRVSTFIGIAVACVVTAVVAMPLYALCDSSVCNAASHPCSQSQLRIGQDGARACYYSSDENGNGVEPGRCLTTNENCATCNCVYAFSICYGWRCSCEHAKE